MPIDLRAASRLCLPLFLLVLLVSAGCSEGEATAIRTLTATSTDVEEARTARLRVVSGPGGVFAFVRIYIGGKGPSPSRWTRAPRTRSSTTRSCATSG
jgi:hypothetical protein